MAEDAADRVRGGLIGRAPELRKALVGELAVLIERAAALDPDEAAILRHVLAYAGYSLDGSLYLPAFAVLWGEEASYIPAAHLPPERARAAAFALRRRGVLRDLRWTPRDEGDTHTEGVVVEMDALRALAAAAAGGSRRRVILSVAVSLDGFVAKSGGLPALDAPEEVATLRGDAAKAIARLRRREGGDIVCTGGAAAVHALLKKDLVDVLIVSLVPALLGGGAALFKRGRPERSLKLVDSKTFPTGLVRLRYERA
jgi:dihydrofolate reductase